MSLKENFKKKTIFNKTDKYLIKIEEKIKEGKVKEIIKNEIIKEFKEEKAMTTNILQKLLNEQIKILDNKTNEFKNKEYFTKEDIDKHNNEINELQRKINELQKQINEKNKIINRMNKNIGNFSKIIEEMKKKNKL